MRSLKLFWLAEALSRVRVRGIETWQKPGLTSSASLAGMLQRKEGLTVTRLRRRRVGWSEI